LLSATIIPTGTTKLFPVIGYPIEQVRSPEVLTKIMVTRGNDAIIVPMQIAASQVSGFFRLLHHVSNVQGVLVTVPHKRLAYEACSTLSERARFVGAVNVVRRTPEGWHGENTDGIGYLDGLEREGFLVQDKRVLLVGCGGAGSAIAVELLERGASLVAIHDIDAEKRDEIVRRLSGSFSGRVAVGSNDPSGFDLVANATPMGMRENDPYPVEVALLQPFQFVACVITKPAFPPLLAEARSRGCRTMTGNQMFDAQADVLADFLIGT
jgi:shikimate dehydrogenase